MSSTKKGRIAFCVEEVEEISSDLRSGFCPATSERNEIEIRFAKK